MEKKVVTEIVEDRINQTNDKLFETMEFLSDRHETIKKSIIDLSYELDEVEILYSKLLEEFKNRKKVNG